MSGSDNAGGGDDANPGQRPGHDNVVYGPVAGGLVQAREVGAVHVHSAPAPPTVVPRQLPPAPANFVDRLTELTALRRFPTPTDEPFRPLVVVLTGLGGVGKTALGVHWGHEASGFFPDGQLYADLAPLRRGGGVEVSDVLGQFLRALGIRDEWIPADLAERAALFRSRTAGRRLLVLLDNVNQSSEVLSLLPSSGASAVLVTSQWDLDELVAEGARLLRLEPLDKDTGTLLLEKACGAERIAADRAAAATLVRLCGGLPIALRVLSARMVGRSRPSIGRLVEELADENRRLRPLSAEGKPLVEAVFDATYRDLPPEAARLYRLLGLHPGPWFAPDAAAVLAALPEESVDDALATLCRGSLLEPVDDRRYRFHELVRRHARERAEDEEPEEEREAVVGRVVDWYLVQAAAADHAVMGGDRLRLFDQPARLEPPARATPRRFATSAAAQDWLDAERVNLLAAIRVAFDRGWDTRVLWACESMWALFANRKHYADWIESHRLGIESARRHGDRRAEARMRAQLARAHMELSEFDRAHDELTEARRAAQESADRRLEASVVEFIGRVHLDQGANEAAMEAFTWSLHVNEEIGDKRGIALQTHFIGQTHARADRHEEALPNLRRAHELMREVGDERYAGRILISLGEIHYSLGRRREAVVALEEAVAVMRRLGAQFYEAQALEALAHLTDDPTTAARHLRRAEQIYADSGSPRLAAVRARLADLPT